MQNILDLVDKPSSSSSRSPPAERRDREQHGSKKSSPNVTTGEGKWTEKHIRRLKSAAKKLKTIKDRTKYWTAVADAVGHGFSKRECYAMYKKLRAQKSSRRVDAEGSTVRSEKNGGVVLKNDAHDTEPGETLTSASVGVNRKIDEVDSISRKQTAATASSTTSSGGWTSSITSPKSESPTKQDEGHSRPTGRSEKKRGAGSGGWFGGSGGDDRHSGSASSAASSKISGRRSQQAPSRASSQNYNSGGWGSRGPRRGGGSGGGWFHGGSPDKRDSHQDEELVIQEEDSEEDEEVYSAGRSSTGRAPERIGWGSQGPRRTGGNGWFSGGHAKETKEPTATRSEGPPKEKKAFGSSKPEEDLVESLMVEGFSASDDDVSNFGGEDGAAALFVPIRGRGEQVSLRAAITLRELFFGKAGALKSFPEPWSRQGFFFTSAEEVRFGLVQLEGGPCGPLAVVQAYVLKHLVAGSSVGKGAIPWDRPSVAVKEAALVGAIGDILWQAGSGRCVVAVEGDSALDMGYSSSRYRPDNITERLELYRIGSREELRSFLEQPGVLRQFTSRKGFGIILLIYSAILSHGIERTKDDMRSAIGEETTLMGRHDYAAQELVNLLLAGGAFPQVFDGQRTLGDEKGSSGDEVLLKGIPNRCEIGFLTLFEKYGYMKVGENMKSPKSPFWVVCSESHYSVLFRCPSESGSVDGMDTRSPSPFRLRYYDELAKQDEAIILTVTPNPAYRKEDEKPPPAVGVSIQHNKSPFLFSISRASL